MYVLSHTSVLANIEFIFSAKSFSLENPSLVNNLQKLFQVTYVLLKDFMLVPIKITYCNQDRIK